MDEHKHPENIPRARCVQNCKTNTEKRKRHQEQVNNCKFIILLFYDSSNFCKNEVLLFVWLYSFAINIYIDICSRTTLLHSVL